MLSGLLKTDVYANCQDLIIVWSIEVLKHYTVHINICYYYVPNKKKTLMKTLFNSYFLGAS